MIRRAAALAALLLLTVPPTLGSGSARAQLAPAAPARVSLAALDTTVSSSGTVLWAVVVEHLGTGSWEQVEIVADLHGALGSRSALRAALAGGSVPERVERVTVPATLPGPLAPGSVVQVDGRLPLTARALTRDDTAVHPLRLRVLADGVEVGRIDTAIVRLGGASGVPLATTLVWPLSTPPAHGPDGDPAALLDPETAVGGRLDTLAAALGPVPVTGPDGAVTVRLRSNVEPFALGVALDVPVHLMEDLALRALPATNAETATATNEDAGAVRADGLRERIRDLAATLPGAPLVTPYGDADIGRLLASGTTLRPLAGRAVLEGASRVAPMLGREPSAVLRLGTPVDRRVLDLLSSRTLLVPYAAIEGPDLALDVPLADPVRTMRSSTGRVITALVGDPYLTEALGASTRAAPADPVLAAHEVVARTAMVHLEAPGRAGRSLVLLPPPGFDPDPRFADELLRRLSAAPWLLPRPPALLPDDAARPFAPAVLVADGSAPLPSRLATALVRTERDLTLLAGAVEPVADLAGASGPVDVPLGGRLLRNAADELLRASSRAFTDDVDGAVALLDGVRGGVAEAFGTFAVTVNDVTLTDRDGTVPITIRRSGGVPMNVRVEVAGPAALTWTDGRVRDLTLEADAEPSIEVPVRSGATGRFPVRVRVTDPTGSLILVEDIVGLRATALAGPALALIGLTVLGLTVVGTSRQRRRGLAWRTTVERDRAALDRGEGTEA